MKFNRERTELSHFKSVVMRKVMQQQWILGGTEPSLLTFLARCVNTMYESLQLLDL